MQERVRIRDLQLVDVQIVEEQLQEFIDLELTGDQAIVDEIVNGEIEGEFQPDPLGAGAALDHGFNREEAINSVSGKLSYQVVLLFPIFNFLLLF